MNAQVIARTSSISALMVILLAGCAAPGSKPTRSSISGKLLDRRGRPMVNQKVTVSLPASYGLEGLDRVMGKPEDYGHRNETAVLRTDRDGEFRHLFEVTTRSITFFILPPLGAMPRQPPKPTFRIETPRGDYLAGWNGDRFDYRALSQANKPAAREAGAVTGSYVERKLPRPPYEDVDGWETFVEIRE